MSNKPALSISEQIQLLKNRKMLFRDETQASHFLENISYYRLKGYWWDMQQNRTNHIFKPDTYFEEVIKRYNFDRHLRLILFNAVERIEIALRTKMIYHLSISHGSTWYHKLNLFSDRSKHNKHLTHLQKEFNYSQEIFIKDHKRKSPNTDADAWKILEVTSIGTLSKLYKNLKHQLPEKSLISKGMGLNLHSELSSWLEAIVYIRNIIAHHSRLWSRNMVKTPIKDINNPTGLWLDNDAILPAQIKKPFLIISSMIFLCNKVTPNHQIKKKIVELIDTNPDIPVYKIGFFNKWKNNPIWK